MNASNGPQFLVMKKNCKNYMIDFISFYDQSISFPVNLSGIYCAVIVSQKTFFKDTVELNLV